MNIAEERHFLELSWLCGIEDLSDLVATFLADIKDLGAKLAR